MGHLRAVEAIAGIDEDRRRSMQVCAPYISSFVFKIVLDGYEGMHHVPKATILL